jgi:hypothetical protein
METMFAAGMLLQPFWLVGLAFVILCSIFFGGRRDHSSNSLPWQHIASGFLGVLLMSLLIAAVGSYVSPEGAKRFGVGSEHYASALWHQFVAVGVVVAYLSLLGCAVIGVPITRILAKRGFATVPIVVAASIPVSLVVFVAIVAVYSGLFNTSFDAVTLVILLLVSHALAALGFAVGARLPWRLSQVMRRVAQPGVQPDAPVRYFNLASGSAARRLT